MNKAVRRVVELSSIDLNDTRFKISRVKPDEKLRESVEKYGLLELPVLVEEGTRFIPLTCHNRIQVCFDLGINNISAYVTDYPIFDYFYKYYVLKKYAGAIGPVGRIRAINIIETCFSKDINIKSQEFIKSAGVPPEYLIEYNIRDLVLSFPDRLLEYIDEKDLSFKVIRDLAALDGEILHIIDSWLKNYQIRQNIFKKIIDHVFDISRKMGWGKLAVIDFESVKTDEALYGEIFKIRYPQYSKINQEALEISRRISGKNIAVDFPEFFEKDFFTIKVNVWKNSSSEERIRLLQSIDQEEIDSLLKLL